MVNVTHDTTDKHSQSTIPKNLNRESFPYTIMLVITPTAEQIHPMAKSVEVLNIGRLLKRILRRGTSLKRGKTCLSHSTEELGREA